MFWLFVFCAILIIALGGTIAAVKTGALSRTAPIRDLTQLSHTLVELTNFTYAGEQRWGYRCSCGITDRTKSYGNATESAALDMFKDHSKLHKEFSEESRREINSGISRNAEELKDLTNLSNGISVLSSYSKESRSGRY